MLSENKAHHNTSSTFSKLDPLIQQVYQYLISDNYEEGVKLLATCEENLQEYLLTANLSDAAKLDLYERAVLIYQYMATIHQLVWNMDKCELYLRKVKSYIDKISACCIKNGDYHKLYVLSILKISSLLQNVAVSSQIKKHNLALQCSKEVLIDIKNYFEMQHEQKIGDQDVIKAAIHLIKAFDLDKIINKNAGPKSGFLKGSRFRHTHEIVKEIQKNIPIELRDSSGLQQLRQTTSEMAWISDFNIGNIMHMKSIPYDFFTEDSFQKLNNLDSTLEILMLYSIALFSCGTEMRFIFYEKTQKDKKHVSLQENQEQFTKSENIHFSCLLFAASFHDESDLLEHFISSFQKNYGQNLDIIEEVEEKESILIPYDQHPQEIILSGKKDVPTSSVFFSTRPSSSNTTSAKDTPPNKTNKSASFKPAKVLFTETNSLLPFKIRTQTPNEVHSYGKNNQRPPTPKTLRNFQNKNSSPRPNENPQSMLQLELRKNILEKIQEQRNKITQLRKKTQKNVQSTSTLPPNSARRASPPNLIINTNELNRKGSGEKNSIQTKSKLLLSLSNKQDISSPKGGSISDRNNYATNPHFSKLIENMHNAKKGKKQFGVNLFDNIQNNKNNCSNTNVKCSPKGSKIKNFDLILSEINKETKKTIDNVLKNRCSPKMATSNLFQSNSLKHLPPFGFTKDSGSMKHISQTPRQFKTEISSMKTICMTPSESSKQFHYPKYNNYII